MLAGVYSGVKNIECREIPTPEINNNEMLIKVKAAAVCGTDLRVFKGEHFAVKEEDNRVLGHEFAGEVVEVGENVRGFYAGMKVGVEPNMGCGICRYCRMGRPYLCPDYIVYGLTIDGGFAEYVKVNENALMHGNVVPFDSNTSFEEAALTEPLACCFNTLQSVCTGPGDRVLVIGAGPMGMLHTQLNRLAGASKVMVADISDSRLQMADAFTPDILINSHKQDLVEEVMGYTQGRGADVVITACPVPAIQKLAVQLAAKLGRISLFGGLPKGRELVDINTNLIHYKGLVVTGTTGSSPSQYAACLDLVVNRKINTKSLISRRFNLEHIKEAFEYAMSGQGLKTLIVM
ncbi:MAG: zinc-dependent dehydrogenase [Spirochaetota bacterium]